MLCSIKSVVLSPEKFNYETYYNNGDTQHFKY